MSRHTQQPQTSNIFQYSKYDCFLRINMSLCTFHVAGQDTGTPYGYSFSNHSHGFFFLHPLSLGKYRGLPQLRSAKFPVHTALRIIIRSRATPREGRLDLLMPAPSQLKRNVTPWYFNESLAVQFETTVCRAIAQLFLQER